MVKLNRLHRWLFIGWLVASLADLVLPAAPYYRADPIFTPSVLVSLAIAGAVAAGQHALQYVLTTRRKTPPVDRGKLDDIRFTGNGYGEFIPRGYGKFRVGGNLIDATEIVHSTSTTPGRPGGKGTPRPPTPATINHHYTTTLGIAVCEGLGSLGSNLAITKIWEGVTLIFNTSVTTLGDNIYEAELGGNTLAGGASVVAHADASSGEVVELPNGGSVLWNDVYGTGTNAFLEFYYASTAANSVTFDWNGTVFGATLNNSGGEFILYRSSAFALNSGHVNDLKITNNSAAVLKMDYLIVRITGRATGVINPNVIQHNDDATHALPFAGYLPERNIPTGVTTGTLTAGGNVNFTVYTGTETQTANSALSALHGAANTPAYRGTVYVTFDSYQLKDPFLPSFSFEVNTGVVDLDDIVTDLYAQVGVTSAELDLTALASDSFGTDEGFVITSRDEASKWIEDLGTLFQFDMVEIDGKVKAVKRNGAAAATITAEELRAHWAEQEAPESEIIITDVDPLLLPRVVEVGYLDPLLDYHHNVQRAQLLSGPYQGTATVNLPFVLTANRARQLAETLLHQRHLEARSFTFTVGPKYQKLHPGDVVTLQGTNATHEGRIVEQGIAFMGPQEFEAVRTSASVYSQTISGTSGDGAEQAIIPYPANTRFRIIDTAILRPEDAGDGTQAVVYVGACVSGSGTWQGAFLKKESPINSGLYELRLALDQEASLGLVASGTAGTIDRTVWDRSTSFVVDFFPVTSLSSTTEATVMNDPTTNLFALGSMAAGWNIGQFTTVSAGSATSPYNSRYTISGILWDRFSTGAPAAGSLANLDFVLLNAAVKPMPVEVSDVGVVRQYRCPSSGQSDDQSPPATSFTLEGVSLKPPAPVNIKGSRDTSNNLFASWTRRERLPFHLRDSAGTPLGEEEEIYQVAIMNGADVVRGPIRIREPQMQAFSYERTILFDPDAIETDALKIGIQRIDPTRFIAETTASTGAPLGGLAHGDGIGFIDATGTAGVSAFSVWVEIYSTSVPVHFIKTYVNGTAVHTETITSYYTADDPVLLRVELINNQLQTFAQVAGRPPQLLYTGTLNGSQFSGRDLRALGINGAGTNPRVLPIRSSFLYTAAQQTADFGSTQSSVTIRVAQESAIVGIGEWATATI